MGVQKRVKGHYRAAPKGSSKTRVHVDGHLRIKRTDIKRKGKGK